MEQQKIIESLSPIERKVLPLVAENSFEEIIGILESNNVSVLRALEFLKNKNLVNVNSSEKKIVSLGVNGIYYLKKQLPERRVLEELKKRGKIPFGEIKNICKLNENEVKVSIGVLKKKAMINVKEGRIILTASEKDLSKKTLEELFLEKLPQDLDSLSPEDKFALESLKSRKEIIEFLDEKKIEISLTDLGIDISKQNLKVDLIEQLTPKMINSQGWKGKKFRRYDIHSQAPREYFGKRHFTNQATDYAKKIWLEMGFKEMSGNFVDTSFWVFDSLFTAQDHPVREMQDTFFIKGVEGKLPEKKIVDAIKKAHEGGVDGSKGWQQKWSEEDSKKVLLRTHTTCLSARTLQEIGKNLDKNTPAKFFALGKCFRNETVDWSHGFEFNQTEGIVIDENANFRQLLGYLKQFFTKMGYEKIRIRPAYFAYTEPSLEIDVFHPVHKEWVELGGAGMFRPEVTIPMFGKHIPVLAWGPGFDRIIMEFFKITDLRDMYKNNITKLREMRYWDK